MLSKLENAIKELEIDDNNPLQRIETIISETYTVMGFLWITFGHHSYHLGQVDMLMRQNGIYPAEYMEWPNTSTLIG